MLLNIAGQNVNITFRKKLQNVKKEKILNNLVYEYLPQGGFFMSVFEVMLDSFRSKLVLWGHVSG
jgi:hypothetical protein